MTDSQLRKLAEDFPGVTKIEPAGETLPGWFGKPNAIREALKISEKVCWLDSDVELIKNMDDIFDLAQEGSLGLVLDYWATDRAYRLVDINIWNSGVVIAHGDCDLLDAWVEACAIGNFRGDQEELADLVDRCPELDGIHTIDLKYNYQRLCEPLGIAKPEDLRAYHWTGPTGKRALMASWDR